MATWWSWAISSYVQDPQFSRQKTFPMNFVHDPRFSRQKHFQWNLPRMITWLVCRELWFWIMNRWIVWIANLESRFSTSPSSWRFKRHTTPEFVSVTRICFFLGKPVWIANGWNLAGFPVICYPNLCHKQEDYFGHSWKQHQQSVTHLSEF